jgi:hypothetical protein
VPAHSLARQRIRRLAENYSSAHLELEAPDVVHEKLQKVVRVDFLGELSDDLWLRLVFCG